ncbi:hypothetical protein J6590_050127 [Homalodisca vitripennis]|nr:hypothetical protein J6590_050127 [Homalodisca vitripennis]
MRQRQEASPVYGFQTRQTSGTGLAATTEPVMCETVAKSGRLSDCVIGDLSSLWADPVHWSWSWTRYYLTFKNLPTGYDLALKNLPRGYDLTFKNLLRRYDLALKNLPRGHDLALKNLPRGHDLALKNLPRGHDLALKNLPRGVPCNVHHVDRRASGLTESELTAITPSQGDQ